MTEWDAQVLSWLEGKAVELRSSRAVELCQGVAGRTWRRNADGYDESAGDTPRSLGVAQSENLRELMRREYRDDQQTWKERGVVVSAPEQSLLVSAAELSLHPMKARNNVQREPEWGATRWSERSHVRLAAARYNRDRYSPAFATPLPGMESMQDPNVLRHVMVVYCGDLDTGRTAGWLAVPSADKSGQESGHPWMAAVLVWWDEGDAGGRGSRPADTDPTPPTRFDTQPKPEAPVTLKPARRPSAN